MNANELADEFETLLKECEKHPWGNFEILYHLTATMLRQQQAEIEALKDFAIWMTGCGYDFHQHIYFNEFYDKFLRKEKEHE